MRGSVLGLSWVLWVLLPICSIAEQASQTSGAPARSFIAANDNRTSAGTLANGVLTLKLVAEQGQWQPEGPEGRTVSVVAFREETGALSIPGPLVRVPAGTRIRVSIRNAVPGSTLRVFGMHGRPATAETVLDVPAGETREAQFPAGDPGTYHYWATTTGATLERRFDVDSQLGGAFIVDPPGAHPDDRILVVSVWRTRATPRGPVTDVGTINGRAWPFTERLDYRIGSEVHWRVVNLSYVPHAMHLHGMFFNIVSAGDGLRSRAYPRDEQPLAVTQHVSAGEAFEMLWRPERPGNWLFHCHMLQHMTPEDGDPLAAHQHGDDSSGGMAGLVVGIRVTGNAPTTKNPTGAPRQFTLRLREEPNRYGDRPGYRVDAEGIETARVSPGPVPGPVIVLTRGEPVAVDLVNEMREATAIHWHGIELESYFDGVPGWGGTPGSTTPAIDPGQTFTARFTPPRAGTFIYHTHWHDEAQLGGLYGALIVVEPGQRYDAATDHVFIAGYDGPLVPGRAREPIVVNGRAAAPAVAGGPTPTPLRANVPNRVRLINITPDDVALTFVLTDGFKPVAWKAIAKDGADLPPQQRTSREARQLVSVGETYDFEIQPTPGQRLWLELRRGGGEWVAQTLLVAAP